MGVYLISAREIRSTFPLPFWAMGKRWAGRAYRGIFRAFYAPVFSPLEIKRCRNGRFAYAAYLRPLEAEWTPHRVEDRLRQGPLVEEVPNPLSAEETRELLRLDDQSRELLKPKECLAMLRLYRKLDKDLTLIFCRVDSNGRMDGFERMGYDVGELQGDHGSRIFDLLFQDWARTPEEAEWVHESRSSLNSHGLFATERAAADWGRTLETARAHPACCRGGQVIEVNQILEAA